MAGPGRRGVHARGRHSAQSARSRPPRRAAPVAAFLAVLVVALGGTWAFGLRGDGDRPDGLVSADRDTGQPTAEPSPQPDDLASRDKREAPVPALGPMATGSASTTPTMTPAPSATTGAPRRSPSTRPTTPAAPRPGGSSSAPATGVTAEVTRLTNIERANAGCGAVRVDARLAAAAQAHSTDMVDRDYFSHTSPDGKGPGDRASAAGYPRWSGENIAAGYPTPAAVVQGWMNSPGHKANILNCQSKATGVGYDARRNMWTQMFGFE